MARHALHTHRETARTSCGSSMPMDWEWIPPWPSPPLEAANEWRY
uniref:Uncharacterized protein n=1 Tax=Arundo donax TaxID=35708 RepID=A0A0A8Y7K7_ARUDO